MAFSRHASATGGRASAPAAVGDHRPPVAGGIPTTGAVGPLALVTALFMAACGSDADASADPSATGGMLDGGRNGARDAADAGAVGEGPRLDGGAVGGEDAAQNGTDGDTGHRRRTIADCFAGKIASPSAVAADYDRFEPTVGSHCFGTDHQRITGVERVVFLGDSITVGTPPAGPEEYYRSQLADALAERFSLVPPSTVWKHVHVLDGTSLEHESGGFASCAAWGARSGDISADGGQLERCFSADRREERTLVVMTVGGNDLAAIAEDGAAEGRPLEELWGEARHFVQALRDAIDWLQTPGRFPNGVFVLFANVYEYTDGTGDRDSCPAARLSGDGAAWSDPSTLAEMLTWANEQYLRHAVETGTDMIFMREHFCGHGFARDDPMSPCYRGPDTEPWFDGTCIHPNATGHAQIARMFQAVVDE